MTVESFITSSICYLAKSVTSALFSDYWTFYNKLSYLVSRRYRCWETSVIYVLWLSYSYMNLMVFSLLWSDNCLINVILSLQTLRYCSLKQRCGLSAAVVHSGGHASVLLKPTHCKTFCGYSGSFHSFRRKLTPAAAVLHAGCGCSPIHPTAERQPRLTSAFNTLPSMSARTV